MVLRMSWSGLPSSKTRSADLPASTVPRESASPKNSAGAIVAVGLVLSQRGWLRYVTLAALVIIANYKNIRVIPIACKHCE